MRTLLDLLRHGEAAPAGPGGDRARPLTPAGEVKLRTLAIRLAASEPAPRRAFASPRLRAEQSANIVLSIWSPALAVETLEALEPDTPPARLLAALAERGAETGHLLLIGHLPLLDQLCELLTGHISGFAAGSLLRIEFEGPIRADAGRSLWQLDP